jgi:hypothetical protein
MLDDIGFGAGCSPPASRTPRSTASLESPGMRYRTSPADRALLDNHID